MLTSTQVSVSFPPGKEEIDTHSTETVRGDAVSFKSEGKLHMRAVATSGSRLRYGVGNFGLYMS